MEILRSVRNRAVRRRLSQEHLILFLRQFSVLIESALPVDRIFRLLTESETHPSIRKTAAFMAEATKEGAMISEAMTASGAFPALLISMVETGEHSGSLAEMLARYGKTLERDARLRKKVQTAFIYPVILSVVSVAIVAFLLLNVLPSITVLFEQSHVVLPMPTRLLLGVSQALSTWGGLVLGVLLMTAIILWIMGRKGDGMKKDRWLDTVPLIGTIRRDRHTVRLASLMALYYESNHDLLRFLRILAKGTENAYRSRILFEIAEKLESGTTVADSFQSANYYPAIFVGMMRTGEQTGRLAEIMDSVASYMDMEAELKLTRWVTVLEPALILALSGLVAFIVLAIAMPMFEMVHLYDF